MPDIDEDFASRSNVASPKQAHIAGRIWLIFGILILVNAAANFLLGMAGVGQPTGGAANQPGAQAAGNICGLIIGVVIGGVFIHVGNQTLSGKAKDTMGNAIGSLILGVLNGGIGAIAVIAVLALPALAASQGLTIPPSALIIGYIGSGINLLSGLALLVAGILAIMGRDQYRAWRRSHNGVRVS